MARAVSDGQAVGIPLHPDCPGNERGKEPSEAYRQDLPQRIDAIYVNLGTLYGSPSRSGSACDYCHTRDGASVVLRPCGMDASVSEETLLEQRK